MPPPQSSFPQPTSVFLCGASRPLLNWVTYAFASSVDPEFIWTDLRLQNEVLDPEDPLARELIPSERLNLVHPSELARSDPPTPATVGSMIRPDEPPATVRRLIDFARLPLHTQRLLAGGPPGGQPFALVLSNAHRMAALYPPDTVAPVVRAIVEGGAVLFVTFADAPPDGRLAFDAVFHLDSTHPKEWRRAKLRVERAPPVGPLRTLRDSSLESIAPVAAVLGRTLG